VVDNNFKNKPLSDSPSQRIVMSTIAKSLQRKAVWSAILLLAAAALPARGIDPDLPYSSGSTGVDGPLTFRTIPNGRNSHSAVYDGERQEVVLFGGYNGDVPR
jgi:hypothetical protein